MESLTVTSVLGMIIGQVFSLVVMILVLLGLGKLASRLMDVPFNLPRLALAAMFGAPLGSVGAILAYYGSFDALNTAEPARMDQPGFMALMLFAMAVGSMLAFVALELLMPRGTRVRPVAMLRETTDLFGRLGRYRAILWIHVRHGLGSGRGGATSTTLSGSTKQDPASSAAAPALSSSSALPLACAAAACCSCAWSAAAVD